MDEHSTLQVNEEDFFEIEKRGLSAKEYGVEILGLMRWCRKIMILIFLLQFSLRVPLYTRERNDGGLPMFLKNNFAGNARENLIESLVRFNVLSSDEVKTALEKSCWMNERTKSDVNIYFILYINTGYMFGKFKAHRSLNNFIVKYKTCCYKAVCTNTTIKKLTLNTIQEEYNVILRIQIGF